VSHKLRAILAAVFVLGCLGVFAWWNITKPRVLVLHSYDEEYPWTRGVNAGLRRVLDHKTEYSMHYYYMDAKRHPWPEFIARSALAARLLVERWRPDLVIAADDDAQRGVMNRYANVPRIRIVFAGINGEISAYGYDKADNVTGILERVPWRAIRDALLASDLARGRREIRVLHLGDASAAAEEDVEFMKRFDWAPIHLVAVRTARTFEQWKAEVIQAEGHADVILVGNYRQLANAPGDKNLIDPKRVVEWTEANSPLPLMGFKVAYTEDGGAVTLAASPYEQGEVAAAMAVDILDHRKQPNAIPVASTRQFVVSIRASGRSTRLLGLPPLYESFARATNTYIP